MKVLRFIFLFCLVSYSLLLRAQIPESLFGIGLQKDIFAVQLNESEVSLEATKVSAIANVHSHYNFGVGFERLTVFPLQHNYYSSINLLTVNVGYQINSAKTPRLKHEAMLSFSNSIKEFGAFKDFSVSFEINEVMYNAFHIGTGLRYTHSNNSYRRDNSNCLCWYWNMGFRLFYKRTAKSVINDMND